MARQKPAEKAVETERHTCALCQKPILMDEAVVEEDGHFYHRLCLMVKKRADGGHYADKGVS